MFSKEAKKRKKKKCYALCNKQARSFSEWEEKQIDPRTNSGCLALRSCFWLNVAWANFPACLASSHLHFSSFARTWKCCCRTLHARLPTPMSMKWTHFKRRTKKKHKTKPTFTIKTVSILCIYLAFDVDVGEWVRSRVSVVTVRIFHLNIFLQKFLAKIYDSKKYFN